MNSQPDSVQPGPSKIEIYHKNHEAASTGSTESDSPLKNPKVKSISRSKKRMINYVRGAAGIRKSPQNPIFPPNGLSIVERFFHYMPSNSAQVVLTYGAGLILPKNSTFLSVSRVVDVAKLTAAEIYRTACSVDYNTQTFQPIADTANNLIVPHKFTELKGKEHVQEVMKAEVNQRYNVNNSNTPLWNIHILGPKEMVEGIQIKEGEDAPLFYVFWSFHHCISDGLSGLAFIRLFMTKLVPEAFHQQPLDLSAIPVTKTPPFLMDNYIDANFFQLIPGILYN
jgi:hypothetical protein